MVTIMNAGLLSRRLGSGLDEGVTCACTQVDVGRLFRL